MLTYNLFWWNLFGLKKGNGNSAGNLIRSNMQPLPFDFMGFQECEDPAQVLGPVDLMADYEAFQGGHAICMAYHKRSWTLLAKGEAEVAEDMKQRYYGRRGSQWMRLRHTATGTGAFFLNHHGPLAINSGGVCGGQATAYNLLHVIAANAQAGDLVILVGDFNANAAGLTVQGLWPHLVHVFNGDSFGGVDNIFTNAQASSIIRTENLGNGGSDHNAIAAVVGLGSPSLRPQSSGACAAEPSQAVQDLTGAGASAYDWERFWCGKMEAGVEYAAAGGGWTSTCANEGDKAPDWCCRACQEEPRCEFWVWSDGPDGTHCTMHGGAVASKGPKAGWVSGLPAAVAAREAAGAVTQAVRWV